MDASIWLIATLVVWLLSPKPLLGARSMALVRRTWSRRANTCSSGVRGTTGSLFYARPVYDDDK